MRILAITISAAILFSGAGTFLQTASNAKAQGRATAVGVQTVEQRELSETIPVFAEVVTSRDGSVASRIAGNVERVHVLAGSSVLKGDLLAELNTELLEIAVTQAKADAAEAQAAIATARVRSESAQTRFERIAALKDSGSVSQRQFDDSQTDVFVARSELAEAEAAEKSSQARLAETQYRLERSNIAAPFSGVVIEVNTIPGAYIQAGTPIVRLIDTGSFEVQASVPTRYVSSLQPGQSVAANMETGDELKLELRAILPLEDPSTRTRAVRFSAPDLDGIDNIAVGQSLTIQVPVGQARSVLSVPKDALIQSPAGWSVFVAAEGKAEARNVQLGVPLGGRYEVLNGLNEGDMVVIRGNERLRPGQDIVPSLQETN